MEIDSSLIEKLPEYKQYEVPIEEMSSDIVLCVGGDGTVNEVVNGMAYSNSLLHVIPAGSGNDFYKTISKCKEGIMDIDLGKVNDKYFVNSASIGIDSEISNNASLMKKLNITKNTITAIYKELINAGLIEEKWIEVGKANIVYIKIRRKKHGRIR